MSRVCYQYTLFPRTCSIYINIKLDIWMLNTTFINISIVSQWSAVFFCVCNPGILYDMYNCIMLRSKFSTTIIITYFGLIDWLQLNANFSRISTITLGCLFWKSIYYRMVGNHSLVHVWNRFMIFFYFNILIFWNLFVEIEHNDR
jgi:hypothetical protein